MAGTPRSSRQLDLGPGCFPHRAHGHPDLLAILGHRRPEPEAAAALVAGGALPVTGHSLVLIAGVISGAHPEAGRDHGPVLPHHPGMAVELDAHQLTLGGDTLDHRGGVLKRQPHHQPAMLAGPELAGPLMSAAAPAVSQLGVPARLTAR